MTTIGGPRLWAGSTVARRWRATLVLAVLAGLAAGGLLTSIEVARRTASAYERYTESADIASLSVAACPLGVTEESLTDGLEACFTDANTAEVSRIVADVPGVAGVGRIAIGPMGIADPSLPNGWQGTLALSTVEAGPEFSIARPIMVTGRLPAAGADDEIAVNEEMLRSRSVHVGDTLTIGTVLAEGLSAQEETNFVPSGERSTARIVGVVRLPDDLHPAQSTRGIAGLTGKDPMVYLPPTWWQRHAAGAAVYSVAVAVWAEPGVSHSTLVEAIDDRLSDRVHFTDSPISPPAPLTRVIDLQAFAAWLIAATIFVAGAAFVGQAIARTVRRELRDGPTLRALGFDRRQVALAAMLRMGPVAIAGMLLAAATAVIASPIGPVGLARQAEVDPGIRVDGFVVVIGSVLFGVAVIVSAAAVAWRAATRATRRIASARVGRSSVWPLPAAGRAGQLLARATGTRAAAASACLAAAVVVGTGGLLRDIGALESSPVRYGVTWDLVVGAYTSYPSLRAGQAVAASHPDVIATGALRSSSFEVDGHELLLVAFDPATDPSIAPVIVRGRAPRRDDEVALGSEAMHLFHVGIGDKFEPPDPTVTGQSSQPPAGGRLTVVGQVVINDNGTEQRNGGAGALVTNDLFDQIDPLSRPQEVLVKLAAGTDLPTAVGALRRDFGGLVSLARPQADVRNLDRITPQLRVVAPIIALFAVAALAHALITTVGSRRSDLATLRALGFTRWQVALAIGWHAAFVQAVALIVGVPIGLVASRAAWHSIESRLGVAAADSTPWIVMTSVFGGAIAITALAMLFGRRVAASGTAAALRSE